MNYPKRLIEVDLPIKRISEHARREKSIRHGHISTLHIWWARRPLAACRAVICAALWPDPADSLCPQSFRDRAAEIITDFAKQAATDNKLAGSCAPDTWNKWQFLAKPENQIDPTQEAHLNVLRNALLDFIADFANWDNSTNEAYLATSRALTQAAHEALGGEPGTRPLVVDPFAGGGAIPLEALRVGADAFASDLNPVAVLLNKVVLEYVPRYGQRLADEVRKWGAWVKERAEKELAEFYPKEPDGATPIAYLWARTIKCEGPNCGADIPLLGSLWLSRKKEPKYALSIDIQNGKVISFDLVKSPKQVSKGLTSGNKASCPVCGYVTLTERVRSQLDIRSGGSVDAKLYAVITSKGRGGGNQYRIAEDRDEAATIAALSRIAKIENSFLPSGIRLLPDEACPPEGALGYRFQRYGIREWRDLYTPRQLLSLTTFTRIVASEEIKEKLEGAVGQEMAVAVQTLLSLGIGRLNDRSCSLCRWEPDYLKIQAANGGQNKMPMLLDFVESNPFSGRSGDWLANTEWIAEVIEHCSASIADGCQGNALQFPAQEQPLPDEAANALVTDPPYYNAFGYSDLSEFFYIWLRRSLPKNLAESFAEAKPPKSKEAIVIGKELSDERGLKDHETYLAAMRESFEAYRRVVNPNGVAVIVFASKDTAAWEAILEALVSAGWVIAGSWPIDTEMAHRTRALGSAALHSSIHIFCRPREYADGSLRSDDIGDYRDVLHELPERIREWMPRLAAEGVVGADAIFACLGPALEIFSRYSRVEKVSGDAVTLREYLEHVWAAVSKEALNMIFAGADATGFEADSRLTAMWFWTLSTSNSSNTDKADVQPDDQEDGDSDDEQSDKAKKATGYSLEFDAARKIAQGLGVHLEDLNTVVEVKGDKAWLLPVAERSRFLFGKNEDGSPQQSKQGRKKKAQLVMFEGLKGDEDNGGFGDNLALKAGATTLDRIHQSMLLFAAGRAEALKRFLVEDGIGRDQRFWRLADALSKLYPMSSDEKRWVDGVLARKKGLGF